MRAEEFMTVITLPPEIEEPLQEEARRRGTSPEMLALDALRVRFASPITPSSNQPPEASLTDFLTGYAGTIAGSPEPLSEHCGERFGQGLEERGARAAP